jgi:hypothetical protein
MLIDERGERCRVSCLRTPNEILVVHPAFR